MSRWRLGLITGAVSLGGWLAAQAPAGPKLAADEFQFQAGVYRPVITLTSGISLVQVAAMVRERDQTAVDGLTAGDFEIRDDGVLQHIAGFEEQLRAGTPPVEPGAEGTAAEEPAAERPRFTTIFFDDYNTGAAGLAGVRAGAWKYIGSLPANSEVAIATTSGIGSQDFTADRALLAVALNHIGPHQRGCDAATTYTDYETHGLTLHFQASGGKSYHPGTGSCSNNSSDDLSSGELMGHLTMDSILAQVQNLGWQPGERIFLLASYGVFSAEFINERDRIAEAALRDGIVINTLDARGAGRMPGWGTPELDLLADLSRDTGGQFLYGSNDVAGEVGALAQPPEISYLLSFAPAPAHTDGLQHRLSVRLTQSRGRDLAARTGYFAPAPEPAGLSALREKMRLAVLDRTEHAGLAAEVDAQARGGADPGIDLTVRLRPDLLPLANAGGRLSDTVLVAAELFGAHGAQVIGEQGRLDLRVKPDSVKAFAKAGEGIVFQLPLNAPAGEYRLRTVIAETQDGKLASSLKTVSIP